MKLFWVLCLLGNALGSLGPNHQIVPQWLSIICLTGSAFFLGLSLRNAEL